MDEVTPKKTFNPVLWIVIVAIILIGGYFLFTNSNKQAKQEPIPTQAATAEPTVGAGGETVQKAQSFNVTGANFKFDPNEIRVKKGTKVKITFSSSGGLHDFVIDEFNVRTNRVSDGESDTVEFTADKAGTFEFYCSVGNHRQMGMVGKLIVEE